MLTPAAWRLKQEAKSHHTAIPAEKSQKTCLMFTTNRPPSVLATVQEPSVDHDSSRALTSSGCTSGEFTVSCKLLPSNEDNSFATLVTDTTRVANDGWQTITTTHKPLVTGHHSFCNSLSHSTQDCLALRATNKCS